MASASIVVVTHGHRAEMERLLPSLEAQMRPEDELIVVDNASSDGTADYVSSSSGAGLIRRATNSGFAAAANEGAAAATRDLFVLLNPDVVVERGFRDAIERPLEDDRAWDLWMGLVTLEDGERINTSGGAVHYTGLAWAGRTGRPLAEAPAERVDVGFASGACLAMPLERWRALGGFSPEFFMYCEDVDLSLRVRLGGGRVGIEPAARVRHDYEFAKGALKWRLLERNRWALVLRTYPTPLLVALLPALAATELAIVAAAASQGWLGQKLRAMADLARALPRLLRERREIQAGRAVSVEEFAESLTPDLDSPFLGAPARWPMVGTLVQVYWRGVRRVL